MLDRGDVVLDEPFRKRELALSRGQVAFSRQHRAERLGHGRAEPAPAAADPAHDRAGRLGVAARRGQAVAIGRDHREDRL